MVYSLRSFLLLSTLATAIFAASHDLDPVPTPASLDERAATATSPAPRCWSGTAFPNISQWRSYSELFSIANGTMQYGGNTLGEIANINKAIQNNARSSGIDPRFILAIIIRESSGITTTPCGDSGKSCGLMQVMGSGVPSCTSHPCPASTINKMIQCGTTGCAGGSILDCKGRYPRYGATARCYNTGTVPNPSDWSVATYGIRPYVQDIANLLLGATYPVLAKFDDGRCGLK